MNRYRSNKAICAYLITLSIIVFPQVCWSNTQTISIPEVSKDNCRSCINQATSLFASGHNQDAIELLHKSKESCQNSSQYHLLLSTILARQTGQSQESENEACLACFADNNSIACHLQYGLILMHNQNLNKAIKEFEKVTALDPNNYEAWSSLSNLYKKFHQEDAANKSQTKANTIAQQASVGNYYVYKNLIKQRKYEQAKAELIKIIHSTSAQSSNFPNLVKEALKIGALDETINAGKQFLQGQNKSAEIMESICLAQLLAHNYADCIESSKSLIDIEPRNSDILAIKGIAELYSGYLTQAKSSISAAVANGPESKLVQVANKALVVINSTTGTPTFKLDDELGSAIGLYQAKDPELEVFDIGN